MNKPKQMVPYFAFLLFFWIFTIYTGIMGIDFGKHWDERKLIKSVRDSIPNGEIIPGWYNYPSLTYDLVVASSSPEILSAYFYNRPEFKSSMETWFSSKPMILRARAVFLFTTSLTMLWIFFLAFKWTGYWITGLLGSAVFASSWEIAYHARWLAPDGILMQFGILTIVLVFAAIYSDPGRSRYIWLTSAAVTAGLACGTKYYGGIFLVPVLIGVIKIVRDAGSGWVKSAVLFASQILVFAVVFLLVTPGILVEADKFIQDVQFEIEHYQSGHPGYGVNPGIEHASLLFFYISLVAFSKHSGISVLFFILIMIGFFVTIRDSWNKLETWVFLSVPLLYIPYMSLQKVMFVRNYLLLFPFLAILAARGVLAAWYSYPLRRYRALRLLIGGGLVLALSINLAWLYSSAKSISTREHVDQTQELHWYLLKNDQTKYYVSAPTYRFIPAENLNTLSNIVDQPSQADFYMFLSHEVANPQANRLGTYTPIFGPFEVNFDYYPSWDGDSRIIVMPMKDALRQSQFGIQDEQ
ncbi:MAG TPA: phospholipid carrier-dependent glycosyltransferase [Anaerolineales bacterium]|nr:phospholipid carrier-dependent glycosyltransferase [Anaerolineales bacterium]